jgi:hypothetical protein
VTDEMMSTLALLEKSSDAEFLRDMITSPYNEKPV